MPTKKPSEVMELFSKLASSTLPIQSDERVTPAPERKSYNLGTLKGSSFTRLQQFAKEAKDKAEQDMKRMPPPLYGKPTS